MICGIVGLGSETTPNAKSSDGFRSEISSNAKTSGSRSSQMPIFSLMTKVSPIANSSQGLGSQTSVNSNSSDTRHVLQIIKRVTLLSLAV
jgi:hypothetical protein